jgi:hypothetical protein
MKRLGGIFDQAFTHDALYAAYLQARRTKRGKAACMRFAARLGAEISALHEEILAGAYRPRAYREFMVTKPKPRQILAPDFRDVVIQHAIYQVIYPVFDRSFIDQSFACRIGKGTHRASDYALDALRHCDPQSYVLKLDVRKFFYTIDREILRSLIARKIKDRRMLDVIALFAGGPDDVGIPIGNLLSQLFALIYLNEIDHYAKRALGLRHYVRYVDDMVMIGLGRDEALEVKAAMEEFLAGRLRLTLSRWSLGKVRDGVNFVGYRTWPWGRLVRRYSLHKFNRAVARGKDATVWSLIAHAKDTASLGHMSRALAGNQEMFNRLPEAHKARLAA